jgi:two-component system, NtrC family, response regulator PilR
MRVLVVEDDADLRFYLTHNLVVAGYQVDSAATVGEAQRALDRGGYAFVLTDGRLPDGTGMAVADTASAHDLPALIITGYAFHPAMAGLARYEFLLKPVRPAELLAAIERLLVRAGQP